MNSDDIRCIIVFVYILMQDINWFLFKKLTFLNVSGADLCKSKFHQNNFLIYCICTYVYMWIIGLQPLQSYIMPY